MSLALAYHLGLDVINALEFLHDHGVSHNSIVPANILLVAKSGVSGPLPFVTVDTRLTEQPVNCCNAEEHCKCFSSD